MTERYGLTLKLALLGARYLAGTGLGDVSQPILERLAAATGELARLTVVEGEGLAWVGKAQGARHGLRYDPDAGTHVVLHATATGKAWLATLPEAEALRIVQATGFATPAHFGPNVIRDRERFRLELARTRAQGFGLAIEEGEPGTAAVAVVVRASAEATARVVGTLSVAGPVGRSRPSAAPTSSRPSGQPPRNSARSGRCGASTGPVLVLTTQSAQESCSMQSEPTPRYPGPLPLAELFRLHLAAPSDAAFTRDGPRADVEYRDLGLAAATGGRIGTKHIRAIALPEGDRLALARHDRPLRLRAQGLDHLPIRRRGQA